MRRNIGIGIGLAIIIAALIAWRSCGSDTDSTAKPTAGTAVQGATGSGSPDRTHDGAPTIPASMGGRVTRASDGAGIPGALVSIAPAELMKMFIKNDSPTQIAIADANGVWKAPRVMPGAYVVAATAKGFFPGSRAKLTVRAAEQRSGLDLVLTAGGTSVTGIVTDVGGGPIADARVSASKPDKAADIFGKPDLVATTGADGRYELTLADGEYNLEATHDDYTRDRENVELAGTPKTADFKLVPGAVIRGQVIARDSNKPVPGALIHSENSRGGTGVADDDGNFTLRSISAGSLEISAMGRGYASASPTVVAVGIGEQVEGVRVLVDRAYSISGKVVRKGKPSEGLPGVTLGAFSIAAKAFGIALEPSANDGSFEIVGLKPAAYMLFAVGEGSVPDVGKNVEIVDKDLVGVIVELDAGVTLAGRVDPAVAGAQITIDPAGSIGLANMFEAVKSLLVAGETDASGAFTLKNVPAGAFALKASAPDGRAGSLPIVVADKDQSALLVKLEARASVSGRVIDTSNNPVAGTAVDAVRTDDHEPKISFNVGKSTETKTLADGTFKIVGLEAGKYRIVALSDGGGWFEAYKKDKSPSKSSAEVELAAAATKTGITLTVEARDGVIKGMVIGPDKKPAPDSWVTAYRVAEKSAEKSEGMQEQAKRRWSGTTPVLTNGDGQFTIAKLRRGAYDIVVEGPRGATHAEKTGVKTGETTTIQLLSLGTLTGRVTLGGAPVAKYEIDCDGPNDDTERQIDAADGTYTLERLAPGPYKCSITGDMGTAEGKIEVPAGEAKLDFALTRWASLTGTVVSVLDRKPVTGVMVFAGDQYSDKTMMTALSGKAPKTDANGRFLIERVAAGKGQTLVVPPEGFQPLGMREYTAVEGQRVDVGTIDVVPPRTGDAGTFGMSTTVTDGKLLVASVKDGGPAAVGGVQVGDRITAINGTDVATLKPEVASSLIASGNVGVGQQAQIAIDRAGAAIQIMLVSQKW